MKNNPKISIVTVCYNSEAFIEECILSIMKQTYSNTDHIIVDGGSTDATVDIIKKYDGKYNMRWISEKDNGMYDAICKGFDMATGDIFAWLNSDDMYMPWACEIVAAVMTKTSTRWCTGIPCHYTERGVAYNIPRITPVFPQRFIKTGYMDGRIATFLEQESMFWSRQLWEQCGNVMRKYKMAGDYHLWKEFAKHECLITLDSVISGFRIHERQKSGDRENYYAEVGGLSICKRALARSKIIPALITVNSLFSRRLRIRGRKYLI